MANAKAATAEEIRITEERLIKALREGCYATPELAKAVATVRYVNGTNRLSLVKRTLQSLKARGIVKTTGRKWLLTEEPQKPEVEPSNYNITPAMVSGVWGY